MNEEAILKATKSYLNTKNEISEDEFFKLFGVLELQEQYKVIDIFIDNNIILVENKEYIDSPANNCEVVENDKNHVGTKIYKNISNEQLCLMAQRGDKLAQQSLVIKCKDFICKQVLNIEKRYNHKLEVEDLIQIGGMGLIKAVEKFDLKKGYTFLTYAKFWIDQHIRRHIADEGFLIRLPIHMFDAVNKIIACQSKYKNLETTDMVKKICKELNITKDRYDYINDIKRNIMNPRYLDELINDSENTEVIDSIITNKEDLNCSVVEREAIQNNQREDIQKLLDGIKPKEREVIISRFGLGEENSKKTLDEIGQKAGVTRERIRQIENNALRKMKKLNRLRKLNLDLDLGFDCKSAYVSEPIYSFKSKCGTSRIPERSEIFKKILELYPDIVDTIDLTEKFICCALQNGYSCFQDKEKKTIEQSFADYLKKDNNKVSVKDLVQIIFDLDPDLANEHLEFIKTFNDFAIDSGYDEARLPSDDEIISEIVKYKNRK